MPLVCPCSCPLSSVTVARVAEASDFMTGTNITIGNGMHLVYNWNWECQHYFISTFGRCSLCLVNMYADHVYLGHNASKTRRVLNLCPVLSYRMYRFFLQCIYVETLTEMLVSSSFKCRPIILIVNI